MSSSVQEPSSLSLSQLPPHWKDAIIGSLNDPNMVRAGLTVKERICYVPTLAGGWGLILGGYQGGRLAGFQYMAERQHRLPKTVNDWYFYHKTKNYKVLLAGLKSGFRTSGKLITLGLGYEFLQWSSDLVVFNSHTSWISSTSAGFLTALIFSKKALLPKNSRNFALLAGTGFGLASGLLQELIIRF